jgi:hypothetical protein
MHCRLRDLDARLDASVNVLENLAENERQAFLESITVSYTVRQLVHSTPTTMPVDFAIRKSMVLLYYQRALLEAENKSTS